MEQNSLLVKKELALKFIKLVRPIDIVVIVSSIVAMYLFRFQDGYQVDPIWQLKRSSSNQHAIQVQPLITDLDGNNLKELIIASEEKIEIFSFHADEFDDEHDRHTGGKDDMASSVLYHLHQKGEVSFSEIHGREEKDARYPIAMNSGCTSLLHNEICAQALAVVWSDWTVTLLSHQLKILWRSKPMNITFDQKLQIIEMSVLVAAGNKSVFGEHGMVIVGGVLNFKNRNTSHSMGRDHSKRPKANKTAEDISRERAGVEPEQGNGHMPHDLDPVLAKYVGHFTSYALDGGTGEVRWKHEPGDFEVKQASNEAEEHHSLHFKLRLKMKALHRGEVHWKKYSESFLSHLPYSWAHNSDTSISLGEFQRSTASKASKRTEVLNMADQLMAFAKTGIPGENSLEKKTRDFNVVVIKHGHGIEVLNLDKGSPVCSMPLDSTHSTLADVNGDGNIDLAKLYGYEEKPRCFIVFSDALVPATVLFNSSVCHPTRIENFFGEVTSVHSKPVRSLPPLLTKTMKRSFGILHHVFGLGLSRRHVGMDTIVLTSEGKLSAFEPSGRFLWEVDTRFAWSETDFTPSMRTISLSMEETQDGVVILGPRELMVISLVSGDILSTHSLPCVPTYPLVLGDINNDINDEILVRCSDRYIAFNLERYNRIALTILVYSGIACFVGFVLFAIKFLERDEFPFDTFDNVLKGMRYFPVQGAKL